MFGFPACPRGMRTLSIRAPPRTQFSPPRRRPGRPLNRVGGHRFLSATVPKYGDTDFTHAIIGGGVVGLAVARQLARRPGTATVLLERHPAVGTETSSRNSEVVHAGLYYPPDSLKTRLCVEGRNLLYELCTRHGVTHARTGKWIVAQTTAQRERLQELYDRCRDHGIDAPLRWVGGREARREEPAVRAVEGVLESPQTGIVDSHGLMACLAGQFEDAGGTVALNTEVTGIGGRGAGRGAGGWRLDVCSAGEDGAVTAEVVVNAAGLGAVAVHNMAEPDPSARRQAFYAKGSYFAYSAPRPRVRRLVYPAPAPGAAGLGTHLTLDLAGRMRFGPDVQWVDSPLDLGVSAERTAEALAEIRAYLPDVDPDALVPDYAGIRPKLRRGGAVGGGAADGFQDFVIRKPPGLDGWVDLLGIESPGLTSCLAIAGRVDRMLYG